jgi:hypothetical protein
MPTKGTSRFKATDEQRKLVEQMAAFGVSQEQIAGVLGVSVDTIQRHFRKEIDTAATRANTRVAGALYKNAMEGNVSAQIFWMKTRGKWREVHDVEVSGKDGSGIIPSITIGVNKSSV